MKKILSGIILLGLLQLGNSLYAQKHILTSPDGKIELECSFDSDISWSLKLDNKQLILPSLIGLELATQEFPGPKDKIKKVVRNEVDEIIIPTVPHKDSEIRDHYKEMQIIFKSEFKIIFRAYNDGVAYRFVTNLRGDVIVMNEVAEINLADKSGSWYPLEESFMSHNERSYIPTSLDTISAQHLASLPLLVQNEGTNILITETSLENYAGMWFRGNGKNSLKAVFPHYPEEEKLFRDRDLRVMSATDFIAETEGTRAYPWRVFIISENDAGLIETNLTYQLADTCRMIDTDWIRPGKVAWDWWNYNNIYGVDFRAGLNNDTYKYYIDFASENGLEYVILDEGWYNLGDVLDVAPGFDIPELCSYAESKNVGIILWVVWNTLDDKLDKALTQYEEWGVKGIKVDFMQRDDQKIVDYYWRVAEKAAEHKLLVDYHGSYKPAGLRRTWPNVMTREGVKGLEHCKWSADITPDHNLTIPFIRMVAGPMDYTPGAMINHNAKDFKPIFTRPASMGTRAHQIALYVVFESPLQMLADSPSNYKREQECTDFIAKIPVTWDETKVIEAKIGDYLIIARRKGEIWYVAAMTDWDARAFDIDLSFIGEGDYNVEIIRDGINADRFAQDYKKEEKIISSGELLNIKMASGGGWVAIISK